MGYYEAKFARERKENPCEWVIFPLGFTGCYTLVHIGPARKYQAPVATTGRKTKVPYMRIVK